MLETELKFLVPAQAVPAVTAELLAAGAQSTRLRACYLDTPDRRLAAARAALRLRLEAGQWVQTLKAQGSTLIQRWEHNVPRVDADAHKDVDTVPTVDPSLHQDSPAGVALAAALGCEVSALAGGHGLVLGFETDILRLHTRVQHQGATLEWAFDVGQIRAAGRTEPVCELELELCAGPPSALLALAGDWVSRHGLWLDSRSKAERGERLWRGQPQPPELPAGRFPAAPHDAAGLKACVAAVLEPLLVMNSWVADPAPATPPSPTQLRHWHRQFAQLHRALAQAADPALAGLAGVAAPAGVQAQWAEALLLWLGPLDAAATLEPAVCGRLLRSVRCQQLLLAVLGWCVADGPEHRHQPG